jgi:hypothetical protein
MESTHTLSHIFCDILFTIWCFGEGHGEERLDGNWMSFKNWIGMMVLNDEI